MQSQISGFESSEWGGVAFGSEPPPGLARICFCKSSFVEKVAVQGLKSLATFARPPGEHKRLIRVVALWIAVAFPIGVAAAEDWPNFRGPQHDGISREAIDFSALPTTLPQKWERRVGSAFSSFAVVGERVFTGGTERGQQVLLCLDANTGDVRWTVPIEREYQERQGGDGPRATPTVADGRVYIMGALGKLLCVNADDGKELWSRTFQDPPQWGYSGSVLVHDGVAVVSAGRPDGGLVALDAVTGKERWHTEPEPAGYATPYPFELGGVAYIIGFLGNRALIVDAKNGREQWAAPWRTDFSVNAAAPIFHEGKLFLSSGYGHGSAVYQLEARGEGRDAVGHGGPTLRASKVWENKNIRNKFQSSLLFDGHLFTSDEKGLKCVRFGSGERMWEVPRARNGTLALAAGHLVFLSEEGQLQIAPASARDWQPIFTAAVLDGRCWAAPVIANGQLLVRNLETVRCFAFR